MQLLSSDVDSLTARARNLPVPPMSSDLVDRILDKHARGVTVLLPSGYIEKRRQTVLMRIAATITMIAALAVAAQFISSGSVVAFESRGTLTVAPLVAAPGTTIQATYRGGPFDGAKPLVLRARLRTANAGRRTDGIVPITIATFTRNAGNDWVAAFTLPDSIVYAALAVESSDGETVDNNASRLWEVHAGANGKPSFDALQQRANDFVGRNWEEAFATTRRMTELYPERVAAWKELWFFQDALHGAAASDSTIGEHRSRLARFDSALVDPLRIDAEDIAGMYWYATGVGDSARARKWASRLIEHAPQHPTAIELRTSQALQVADANASRALASLEPIARSSTVLPPSTAQRGFFVARSMNDSVALHTWANRWLAAQPWVATFVWTELLEAPGTRTLAESQLHTRLGALSGASGRSLERTIDEQAAANRAERRRIQGALGRSFVATGRVAEGLALLDSAIADGWSIDLFESAARARFAAGDSAGATALLARVAVDPSVSRKKRDSLAALVQRRTAFDSVMRDARRIMLDMTAQSGVRLKLSRDAKVTSSDNIETTIGAELADGLPTVIMFWSRYCGPSLSDIAPFNAMVARLTADSIPARVLAITAEPPSASLNNFVRTSKLNARILHDTRGEVAQALGADGTPVYVILDGKGNIAFRRGAMSAIPRQLLTLQ